MSRRYAVNFVPCLYSGTIYITKLIIPTEIDCFLLYLSISDLGFPPNTAWPTKSVKQRLQQTRELQQNRFVRQSHLCSQMCIICGSHGDLLSPEGCWHVDDGPEILLEAGHSGLAVLALVILYWAGALGRVWSLIYIHINQWLSKQAQYI